MSESAVPQSGVPDDTYAGESAPGDIVGYTANVATSEAPPEAALVRSFLNRMVPAASSSDHSRSDGEAIVRSYAMTGGRSTGVVHLEFETMLQCTTLGTASLPSMLFERALITQMCSAEILSVAELSARLHLPIGVVRVVAADLVSEGFLEAFMSNLSVADDVSLISRLIEGVRAL